MASLHSHCSALLPIFNLHKSPELLFTLMMIRNNFNIVDSIRVVIHNFSGTSKVHQFILADLLVDNNYWINSDTKSL